MESAMFINDDEAQRYIRDIDDRVTKMLVTMAYTQFLSARYSEENGIPMPHDIDMLFVVKVMERFMSEHSVLSRALAGERVGAFWDEDESA